MRTDIGAHSITPGGKNQKRSPRRAPCLVWRGNATAGNRTGLTPRGPCVEGGPRAYKPRSFLPFRKVPSRLRIDRVFCFHPDSLRHMRRTPHFPTSERPRHCFDEQQRMLLLFVLLLLLTFLPPKETAPQPPGWARVYFIAFLENEKCGGTSGGG